MSNYQTKLRFKGENVRIAGREDNVNIILLRHKGIDLKFQCFTKPFPYAVRSDLEENKNQQERHPTKGKIEKVAETFKNSIKKPEAQGEPRLLKSTRENLNIIFKKY